MDLKDIPAIQQTIASIAQNYSNFIIPYSKLLGCAQIPHQPNRKYTIMLLGNQNTGKSSFINHCIGYKLLPTGHGRTTDKITFVLPGADRQSLSLRQAQDYFPEIADLLIKQQSDATVEIYPGLRSFEPSQSAYLSRISGVFETPQRTAACPFFFIDTPGVTDTSDFVLARQLAGKVDQILFFAESGGFNITEQTCDFLQFLAEQKLFRRMKVVLSKIDCLDTKFQAVQAVANCVQLLTKIVPYSEFQVFPISLPRFLGDKTQKQLAMQKSAPAHERSKLQQSLSLTGIELQDSGVAGEGASGENTEPFLAAQFDLLTELENTLVDQLTEQFNVVLDQFAGDVKALNQNVLLYERKALGNKNFNAVVWLVRVAVLGAFLALCGAVYAGKASLARSRGAIAVLLGVLVVSVLLRGRSVLPLSKVGEIEGIVESQLLRAVELLERAK